MLGHRANAMRCNVVLFFTTTVLAGNALSQDGGYDPRERAQTLSRDVAAVEPQTYRPTAATRVVLDVRQTVSNFNGIQLQHRSYNNLLVGPVIRVRPGTALHIRLDNRLPPETGGHTGDENVPHGFNTTNLHTHGLHVSPKRGADDVSLEIKPGEHFDFTFDIPANHPAGTFWYHSHKHGSTALQVSSGMAGALIVEGGLDNAKGIRGIEEKILALQQFVYFPSPNKTGEYIVDPAKLYNGEGTIVSAVNGQVTPTLTIRPGEVQRWRLIHAGISDVMNLSLPGVEMYEIAIDGLALGTLVRREKIQLYPGYRSDILVKAPASRGVKVLSTKIAESSESLRQRTMVETDVLKLLIEGDDKIMDLPKPDHLKPHAYHEAIPNANQLAFQKDLTFSNPTANRFLINGSAFSSSSVVQMLDLNTAGEWTLKSRGLHPFHVHVNPFAVWIADFDGQGTGRWVWRDTLVIRPNIDQKIRSWFRDFTGRTVLHCHILDHEDKGMMQLIEIVDSRRVRPTQPSARPNNRRTSLQLLLLHRGISCEHCAGQLKMLSRRAREFAELGVEIVAISQELPAEAELGGIVKRMGIDFELRADPELKTFQRLNCLSPGGDPLHGLFIVDVKGRVLWRTTGEEPETDIDKLMSLARKFLPPQS